MLTSTVLHKYLSIELIELIHHMPIDLTVIFRTAEITIGRHFQSEKGYTTSTKGKLNIMIGHSSSTTYDKDGCIIKRDSPDLPIFPDRLSVAIESYCIRTRLRHNLEHVSIGVCSQNIPFRRFGHAYNNAVELLLTKP